MMAMRPSVKPWITPTDAEQFDGTMAFDGVQVSIAGAERDERGILWQPMPERPQMGNVLWKDMHTERQKRAMLEGRCQVCGVVQTERPLTWLIPNVEATLRRPRGRPFTTATPPTCSSCIELARTQCPNLSRLAPTLLLVRHWRAVAVFGDQIMVKGSRRLQVQAELPLGHAEIPRMMARHLVVEIYDYRRAR